MPKEGIHVFVIASTVETLIIGSRCRTAVIRSNDVARDRGKSELW